MARSPELLVSMNPADGEKFGVQDGSWIRVRSRRGDLEGRAAYTEKQRAGELFVPFVKAPEHAANFLTNAALGPRLPHPRIQSLRRPHGYPPQDRGATRPPSRGKRSYAPRTPQDNRVGEDGMETVTVTPEFQVNIPDSYASA